jgi:septum formation protein
LKKLILASKSVDRRNIFKDSGIQFEVLASNIDESEFKKKISDPILLVKELAKAKALNVKQMLLKKNSQAIIIAADTVVELNSNLIGKAKNKQDAFIILKKLMGLSHNLITGIAITETNNSKIVMDYDTTLVEFLNLSDEEIHGYVNTNEWIGRAGAYSISNKASLFITKIQGSSSNVIGFPMHKLYTILKIEFGVNLFLIKD